MYLVLADIVVGLHFAYIAFVVVGQLLILLGALLGWQWVRNFWFRIAHFLMIVVVAVESIFNFECPLTTWERDLRIAGGAVDIDNSTFIARLLRPIIFYDAAVEHPAFKVAYISFALLVAVTLWLAPPRWGKDAAVAAPNEA